MIHESIPVTVVILTKNEERNIKELIFSLTKFDQVIVFDSNSIDLTVKYSEELHVTVESFFWNGRYPKKKQSALNLTKIRNEWVLLLDADERITSSLSSEIREFVLTAKSNVVAGEFLIEYYFSGQKLRFGYRPKKISLIRRGRVHFPIVDDLEIPSAWEVEGHYQPILDGQSHMFNNRLIHKDNDPIQDWMTRHIRYAEWDSALRKKNSQSLDAKKSFARSIFARSQYRSLIVFVYSYFLRLGFLDGKAGFDYAFGLSWYYWLSGLISRESVKANGA